MPWLQTQTYGGFTEKMSQEDEDRGSDLTINVWPTTTDSIDWSQDAEIVIGAGDDLQLLVRANTAQRRDDHLTYPEQTDTETQDRGGCTGRYVGASTPAGYLFLGGRAAA